MDSVVMVISTGLRTSDNYNQIDAYFSNIVRWERNQALGGDITKRSLVANEYLVCEGKPTCSPYNTKLLNLMALERVYGGKKMVGFA